MKNAKTLIAMLLALVMVLALCACGQTATPVEDSTAAEAPADDAAASTGSEKVGQTVLKCAFNQTITNPEAITLQKLSDDLYDATEGRYSIEVYPDAQLGDQAQTLLSSSLRDMTTLMFSIKIKSSSYSRLVRLMISSPRRTTRFSFSIVKSL